MSLFGNNFGVRTILIAASLTFSQASWSETVPLDLSVEQLLQWNDQNVKAGLKPVEVQYYDDRALQTLALDSDRADAIFSVNAMQSYISATTGKTRLVGTVNGGWPLTADIAVGLPKNSPLTKPVSDSINDMIADGTYEKILKRWNLWEEAVSQSQINPPGLPKPKAQ